MYANESSPAFKYDFLKNKSYKYFAWKMEKILPRKFILQMLKNISIIYKLSLSMKVLFLLSVQLLMLTELRDADTGTLY